MNESSSPLSFWQSALPGFGTIALPVIVILFALAAIVFLWLGLKLGVRIGRLRAEKTFDARLASGREDAVKRSRAVLGGQLSEQLAPFLPGFPGDPTEVRFIGKPVDFVAFSGSSRGTVDEIVFIEVKTGGSRLSPVEASLKKAVLEGRVRWAEYRVPSNT